MNFKAAPARLLAVLLCICLAIEPVAAQAPASPPAALPDFGDPSQAGFSPARERRIGEEAMRDIRQNEPAYIDDPELEGYLDSVGRGLAAASGADPLSFQFFALKEDTINAFAMPGGFIGVHSALILLTQNESELAGVLAHEIGHVRQHHIARMLDKQSNVTATVLASFLLAVLAGGRKGGGAMTEAALASGQAAAIQSQLSYSQGFEREADRVGFQTLQASSFDPRGMENFFLRMGRLSRENSDYAYLRTHPLSSERMGDMQGRSRLLPPRIVADSNDYVLLRAKLDAEKGSAREALARVQNYSAARRQDQAARWYSLSRIWLRERNYAEATKALAQLRNMRFESSVVEQLAAELEAAQGRQAEAARIARDALQRFPSAHYLLLTQANALLESGEADKVPTLVRDAIVDDPRSERLYELQARAYAALGKTADQQRAQAELYVLRGNLEAAIEQLHLAQRSGAGDFYTQAGIDARLRELRTQFKEQRANKLE